MKCIFTTIIGLFVGALAFAASSLNLIQPQCCNYDNPLGIETPTFGWKLTSAKKGAAQSAWEIRIASSKGKTRAADVWSSGKVLSDKQFGIVPDGVTFESGKTYYWQVRIWDDAGKASAWSDIQTFSMGILEPESWKAQWIAYDWTENSRMPYFRKEFKLNGKVTKATAFVTGLGAGDFFVNGQLADSTRILDPAQTNYERYCLYSSLDVTSLLNSGMNCMGMMLGDGWFNQYYVFTDFSYGRPMMRAMLLVEYANGTSETFGSDASWQWTEGPVVKSNIYAGEVYDARLAIKDWCKVGLDTKEWKNAKIATQAVPPAAYSQVMPPIRLHNTLSVKDMWKGKDDCWILDFGTNNTAEIILKANLPAGTTVTFKTGEELSEDRMTVDFRTTGTSVVPVQTDVYTSDGSGLQQWMPRFTYHGFRYAEVVFSDPSIKPEASWFGAALVHTDLQKHGSFDCSDSQLTRLHEMSIRTFEGNMQGVPTDCPTREKCGWLGDSHAYIKMACDNYDMDAFLTKYLRDIHSGAEPEWKNTLHHLLKNSEFYFTDKASGIPFMIAPGKRLCGVASPDWGTAVVQLPWHLYVYNGNESILTDCYASMKQWADYVSSIAVDHVVYQGLGDWDPPFGNTSVDTPVEFSSSAFHYFDLKIMAEVAGILGKNDDKEHFVKERDAVKKAMIAKFFNPVAITFGSQTADAMALDFGICPDGQEEAVAKSLVRWISLHRDFINTGIFGLCRIGSALSRNGQSESAFKIFTKKGYMSFEWMWKNYDATTLWECLPISSENTRETEVCSHSHPMQAGFDIWFYEDIAGIRPIEAYPGFKKILFAPSFDVDLQWANASIESRYGEVSSSWKKNGEVIEWEIKIPVGSSGVISVPSGKNLAENGQALKVDYEDKQGSRTMSCYELPSGTYSITVE